MTKKEALQLFNERKVRTVWDTDTEEWYFVVADVVGALTDSLNPTDYIKKLKKRDELLAQGWGQIVTPPLSVGTRGGRQRLNCANMLAETATTELSKQVNPKGFRESAKVAQKGGSVAQAARVQLEHQLGRSVVSSAKASEYLLTSEEDNK